MSKARWVAEPSAACRLACPDWSRAGWPRAPLRLYVERMRIFLCGDLMLGRGVDQILTSPGDPTLHEPYVRDARDYVTLAEETNGPIPRAVPPSYIWGDLPDVLEQHAPDLRIGNLETSITRSDDHARGKGIHYRMSPANVEVLQPPGFDCLSLANNHVLDWGTEGLTETIDTLDRSAIGHCGAGRTRAQAESPCGASGASAASGVQATVWGVGDRSSGIPGQWAAGEDKPGVWLKGADRDLLRKVQGPGPRIVSIHWGENWGYAVPARQQSLARALIDKAGVSIVHGHSSHHPKGMEIYNGGLILYGAGDFINDYEGIGGHERYRPDLTAGYFVDVDEADAGVTHVLAVPFRLRKLRLGRASPADTEWLTETLEAASPSGGVTCRAVDGPAIECSGR